IIDKSSKSHRTSHLTAAYSSATTLTRRSASHPLERKYTMLQPPVQGPPFPSERAFVVQFRTEATLEQGCWAGRACSVGPGRPLSHPGHPAGVHGAGALHRWGARRAGMRRCRILRLPICIACRWLITNGMSREGGTMAAAREALNTVPMFRLLPPELRNLAEDRFTLASFSFGDQVITEGEEADAFFVIASGRA